MVVVDFAGVYPWDLPRISRLEMALCGKFTIKCFPVAMRVTFYISECTRIFVIYVATPIWIIIKFPYFFNNCPKPYPVLAILSSLFFCITYFRPFNDISLSKLSLLLFMIFNSVDAQAVFMNNMTNIENDEICF